MQKNGTTSQLETRIGDLKESVRTLVDAGGEKAGQLKDRAIGVKDSVVENGEVAIDRVSSLIRQNPIAALGIAFAVGYVAIRMIRK